MAAIAHVPVSEYFRTAYEPDAEYVDGKIEERAVGEFDHSRWQAAIQLLFFRHDGERHVWGLPALRIQVSPTCFRVPDVTLVDRSLPEEQIITHPPVAVFEVLSPDDRISRVPVKLQDDERMGIKNILVADPQNSSVWRDEQGELKPSESGPLYGSPCMLDWEQIRKYIAGE